MRRSVSEDGMRGLGADVCALILVGAAAVEVGPPLGRKVLSGAT
jgi:hypothetical protein